MLGVDRRAGAVFFTVLMVSAGRSVRLSPWEQAAEIGIPWMAASLFTPPLTPPRRGEGEEKWSVESKGLAWIAAFAAMTGFAREAPSQVSKKGDLHSEFPSPLRGGVRGGGDG